MEAPQDLADWSLHCFCVTARSTPHRIVDSNGRILLAAKGGVSLAALSERRIPCSENQIALLAAYGLIERNGDVVTTRFPILGPRVTGKLRAEIGAIVHTALPRLRERAAEIVSTLDSLGVKDRAHAIVFGHALDGLLWDRLRARKLLPPTELSIEYPYWRGSFWAAYPARARAGGTNEIREGEVTLVAVWTAATHPILARLTKGPEVRALLRSAALVGSAAPTVRLGAVGPMPVLRPGSPNRIDTSCRALADLASTAIPDGERCRALVEAAGAHVDARDAAVVVAHEVIWEILDALIEEGVMVLPPPDPIASHLFVRVGVEQ